MNTKKIVFLSLMLALGLALNFLESLIPPFTIPGAKLGLANIAILIVLYKCSFKEAIVVTILRVVLASFIRGSFLSIAFYMSLSGATLALISMEVIRRLKIFNVISVSVIGAIMHSLGQIFVAIIYMKTTSIIYYLPIMVILAIVTGIFNGIVSGKIMKTNIFNNMNMV